MCRQGGRERRELLLLLLLLRGTKLGRSPCTEWSLPRLLGDRCCRGDEESAELRLLLPLVGAATTVAAGSFVAATSCWSLERGEGESWSRCRFELRLWPCRVLNFVTPPLHWSYRIRFRASRPFSLAPLRHLSDGGQRFLRATSPRPPTNASWMEASGREWTEVSVGSLSSQEECASNCRRG